MLEQVMGAVLFCFQSLVLEHAVAYMNMCIGDSSFSQCGVKFDYLNLTVNAMVHKNTVSACWGWKIWKIQLTIS